MSDWGSAQDVVERCLIHGFPELPPSKRRTVAGLILGNLTAAGHMKPEGTPEYHPDEFSALRTMMCPSCLHTELAQFAKEWLCPVCGCGLERKT
jgi:hypothetical protein